MTTVYCFHAGDLVHAGHLHQLTEAKRLSGADYLIVGLLTDEAIASYKDGRPIVPFEQRRLVYEALKIVDLVVPQYSRDPTDNLKILRPNFLSHGDDWPDVPGREWIEENGGKLVVTEYYHGLSTTMILERIKERWLVDG